jgi:UDP-N-acetylglucosamine--dolichyl-phosphate N-acetylglucosaminephosphotransferase
MVDPLLYIPLILSFFVSLFLISFWIKKAKSIGLYWDDVHKKGEQKVAGSGGIVFVLSFVLGVLSYIAIQTFYFKNVIGTYQFFAILTSFLLVAGIGFVDDLFGWRKGGLSMKSRIVLVLFSAIPLMVINAGESTMLGINFGILYPLLLIPLGMVATTTAFNMVAGFNGLESSQGIILLFSLSFVLYKTGNTPLSLVLLISVFALIPFYLYNMNPAKVFPGDILTYSIGALIGISAILGNIEKIAVFFFIPYILEVILKSRGKLKVPSFGELKDDGTLKNRQEKFYGIEHLSIHILNKMKIKSTETNVVLLINAFQILIILIGVLIFL